jgi:hypothetical protein
MTVVRLPRRTLAMVPWVQGFGPRPACRWHRRPAGVALLSNRLARPHFVTHPPLEKYSPTRFAWKLKTGRDPGPLTISTHCQNKTCVRHLFSRTRSDLGAATGGHPALLGEDHPNTRLTSTQVLQIRELYATGKFLQKDLAVRFDVSRPALRKIVSRQSWRHL